MDTAEVEAVRQRDAVDTRFILDADHYDTINWFIDHASGIWRVDFNGNRSLDYGQIHHAFLIENIAPDDGVIHFEKLRHIERGFLSASP